jgi:hypothetical protein
LALQVLEIVEARKQFFVAQLYNLPAKTLAREEYKIGSKKIRPLPLERRPVSSLVPGFQIVTFGTLKKRRRIVMLNTWAMTLRFIRVCARTLE